jgi:hypothetical protein
MVIHHPVFVVGRECALRVLGALSDRPIRGA